VILASLGHDFLGGGRNGLGREACNDQEVVENNAGILFSPVDESNIVA
jgi:hypothetical protein